MPVSSRIFRISAVSRVPYDIPVHVVKSILEGIGPVKSVTASDPVSSKDLHGGAFVIEFEDASHAARAVSELSEVELFGSALRLSYASSSTPKPSSAEDTRASSGVSHVRAIASRLDAASARAVLRELQSLAKRDPSGCRALLASHPLLAASVHAMAARFGGLENPAELESAWGGVSSADEARMDVSGGGGVAAKRPRVDASGGGVGGGAGGSGVTPMHSSFNVFEPKKAAPTTGAGVPGGGLLGVPPQQWRGGMGMMGMMGMGMGMGMMMPGFAGVPGMGMMGMTPAAMAAAAAAASAATGGGAGGGGGKPGGLLGAAPPSAAASAAASSSSSSSTAPSAPTPSLAEAQEQVDLITEVCSMTEDEVGNFPERQQPGLRALRKAIALDTTQLAALEEPERSQLQEMRASYEASFRVVGKPLPTVKTG